MISAQEERQRDSEIKVTGKEQFHRGGLSRRWMCNISGGGAGCGGGRAGLFTLRNVSSTSTLLACFVSTPTDCRTSLGKVPSLSRRRTYVLTRRRVAKRN